MNAKPSPSLLVITITILSVADFTARAQDAGATLTGAPGTHRIEILALAQPAKTSELLIAFKPGTDVQAFARRRGLSIKRQLLSDPNMFVLKARSEAAAQQQMESFVTENAIRAAYYNVVPEAVRLAFVPNDPLFKAGTPEWFDGQWHLIYPGRPELDSNVEGAWNRDLTGAGVIIGIADDGVDGGHLDLAPNYVAEDSYDFADKDSNASPVLQDDNHGTSVAGVAAARGGNGIGITGAAPFAKIAGLRLSFGHGVLADYVDATKYHSFGNIRTIKVKNHSYGVSNPFAGTRAERDALADSAAAGTIHAFAAGNSRGDANEDSNKTAPQNSPHCITVAALGSQGIFSSYSSFGANVLVTAPSNSRRKGESGEYLGQGIATTDRSGLSGYNPGADSDNPLAERDYTGDFGGTSSACPLVAGILALGVQANSGLDIRMAKHLLVRSSDVVDASDSSETSDGGWKANRAGFKFNPNYGFGLIDADEFTRLAREFTGVTPLQTETSEKIAVNGTIPDTSQISRNAAIRATTPLEEVEVYLQIDHKARGQLEAHLTSPGGTRSRVFARAPKEKAAEDKRAEEGVDWWFACNAFWGENPAGDWTLTVSDTETGETGTWKSFELRVRMGQLIPAARPAPPAITSFSPNNGAVGTIVTITGTKLNGAASVKFNGVSATFTEKSSTQLAATVPAGATTGPISVTTASGTAASTANFTVSAAPAITSFTPTGSAAGGTVTILGANFTGATAVKFNGVTAVFKVDSPTQITATVPAGATTGRISVTTPAGDDASSANFVVTVAPTVGSFSPTTGVAGTTVVIAGANFTGATAVRFNNVNATAFTVNSANQITATAPPGVSTGAISVTAPSGTATSTETFTVIPPPSISRFSPSAAPVGGGVIISGNHFQGATAVRFGTVDAALFTVDSPAQITATVPVGAGSGSITVSTPAGAASSATSFTLRAPPENDNFAGAKVLTGESGNAAGSNVGATLEAGEPRHAGLSGGKSIWYRWTAPRDGTWSFDTFGSGFDTRLAVYTGNALAALAPVASNDDSGSSTNSSVTFKASAATVYNIAVDGSNEDASQPGNAASGVVKINWKILASPPTISGFTPTSATVGSTITINGANFTGATSVQFNGVNTASFAVLSESQITALVPAGARNGPISVTTPVGTGTSAASFNLATGPSNDHFANAQALTGGAGKVSGTNEAATKEPGEPDHAGESGGQSVWFNWTAPSEGTWTFHTHGSSFDTLLAVYTGSSLSALQLVVGNDDSSVGSTSSVTFSAAAGTVYRIAVDGYVGVSGRLDLSWVGAGNVPAINSFSPTSGTAGTVITIEGVNLTGVTAVNFTGAAATSFTAVSSSRITVTVPPGATTGTITVRSPNGLAISAAQFTVAVGPPNNDFANAAVLTGTAAVVTGSNVGATKEPGEPNHAEDRGGKSVWYRWTAPTSGTWKISTGGSQFDTTLAVYTGDAVNNLKLVEDNDDAGEHATSEVTLRATSGTTYQIAVDGYDGDQGHIVLKLIPADESRVLYATRFDKEEGFVTNQDLDGQKSWTISGTGGNGIVGDLFPGLGQQAFIGLDAPTTRENLTVWVPVNHRPDLNARPVVKFSVLMAILDSENFEYDDFRWAVYNMEGDPLFTLSFDNDDLSVSYALDDGKGLISTGEFFENETIYELTVTMDFARNRWSAWLDDLFDKVVLVQDRPITTTAKALTLGDIDAIWAPHSFTFPGDNAMLFDEYVVLAEGSEVPRIVVPPPSQTVAAGANVVLSVVADGAEPLGYQWLFNGNPVAGGTNVTLVLNNLGPDQAGNYTVNVRNSAGSVTSAPAALTLTQAPAGLVFLKQPQSQSVAAGATVTFSVEVSGTPPFTYDWAFNGSFLADSGNVTGANTPTLALTGVKPEQAGQYEVLVSDRFKFAQSQPAILTVQQGLETGLRLSLSLAPQPRIEWLSKPGATYRIQFTTDLANPNWTFLGDSIPGTGGAMSVTDVTASGAQRFYRLLQTQP